MSHASVRFLASAPLLALILSGAFGCAHVPFFDPATRLLEGARADAQEGELLAAWQKLVRLRERHPESEVAREAFPLAAAIYRELYLRQRFVQPDSPFVTTHHTFLFQWLATFFGDRFPREQAEALFVGLPYGRYREFERFAQSRPEILRWEIHADDDNGIIESVSARPRDADPVRE